jgi:1,4-dihydroxy-2-naphthoate octaprenyltransferase
MNFRAWFLVLRPPFLLLSVVLVLLGTAISFSVGFFDWLRFVLTLLGLLLAHISVNVFNEYFDYKSGIDLETTQTPFSGGSGVLPQGLLKPESVYRFGVVCLAAAALFGIYLTLVSGWKLLPLLILGGLVIYFYTSYLAKWLIGELWAGLGLGILPVLGCYFVQTGSYSLNAFIASVVPGFLTANLLLLNEFGDVEADKKGGRYHLVIALGRRKASRLYAGLMMVTYLWIIVGVVLKLMPPAGLLALASIPFALRAIIIAFRFADRRSRARGARFPGKWPGPHYDNLRQLIPALRANVITVLGTDALLALGYFLSLS